MLQSLICFRTSGHTLAWHSLYCSSNSGLSLTILEPVSIVGQRGSQHDQDNREHNRITYCANRRPWYFNR